MFILLDKSTGGVYAVTGDDGNKVVQIFVDKDDAMRYATLLEAEEDFPPMAITEVEDRQVIATCEQTNSKYSIITPDELVIPPVIPDDPIPENTMEKPS